MTSRQQREVLLAANSSWNLVNFRGAVIAGLKDAGYAVSAAVPDDEAASALRAMGVVVHHVPVDSKGLSPLRDARLMADYYRLLRRVKPVALLTFTPKPNIYGSMAAALAGIPAVNTVTGLGTTFLSGRALQGLASMLYRVGLRRSKRIFFHNPDDRDLFVERGLVRREQAAVVPGSGVDLDRFSPASDLAADRPLTFLFIGRLLKDKGALEFAEAAAIVARDRPARFRMLGPVEDHPKAVSQDLLRPHVESGTVELLGEAGDVRPFIADADCVVLPSYREGLPRVLLEAAAMGVPAIATDVPGCRHVVDHGVTGFLCEARSAISLAEAMKAIADLSPEERAAMGARAREKAERDYSQERVVAAYVDVLREIGA